MYLGPRSETDRDRGPIRSGPRVPSVLGMDDTTGTLDEALERIHVSGP